MNHTNFQIRLTLEVNLAFARPRMLRLEFEVSRCEKP